MLSAVHRLRLLLIVLFVLSFAALSAHLVAAVIGASTSLAAVALCLCAINCTPQPSGTSSLPPPFWPAFALLLDFCLRIRYAHVSFRDDNNAWAFAVAAAAAVVVNIAPTSGCSDAPLSLFLLTLLLRLVRVLPHTVVTH